MEIESLSSAKLLDLPNEILLKILNHLDMKEVFYSVASVSRRLMEVADESISNIALKYSNDKSEEVEIYFSEKDVVPFVNIIKYKKRMLNDSQSLLNPLIRRVKYVNFANVYTRGPYQIFNEIKDFSNLVYARICDLSTEIENYKLIINFLIKHKNLKEIDMSLYMFDIDHVELIMNYFKSLDLLNIFVNGMEFWIVYEASKSLFSYRAIVINEKVLKTFSHVQDLTIVSYYNSDNDKDLQVVFKNMKNLVSFKFSPIRCAWLTDYGITGVDFRGRKTGYSISKFVNMEVLSLNQCPNLTDMSLMEFEFPKLRVLEVNYSKKFSQSSILYFVRRCANLTHLLINSLFEHTVIFDEMTLERIKVKYETLYL